MFSFSSLLKGTKRGYRFRSAFTITCITKLRVGMVDGSYLCRRKKVYAAPDQRKAKSRDHTRRGNNGAGRIACVCALLFQQHGGRHVDTGMEDNFPDRYVFRSPIQTDPCRKYFVRSAVDPGFWTHLVSFLIDFWSAAKRLWNVWFAGRHSAAGWFFRFHYHTESKGRLSSAYLNCFPKRIFWQTW